MSQTSTVTRETARKMNFLAILMLVLSPCPTEDSRNCYWDASTMGNQTGHSFIDIAGTAYYSEG